MTARDQLFLAFRTVGGCLVYFPRVERKWYAVFVSRTCVLTESLVLVLPAHRAVFVLVRVEGRSCFWATKKGGGKTCGSCTLQQWDIVEYSNGAGLEHSIKVIVDDDLVDDCVDN